MYDDSGELVCTKSSLQCPLTSVIMKQVHQGLLHKLPRCVCVCINAFFDYSNNLIWEGSVMKQVSSRHFTLLVIT